MYSTYEFPISCPGNRAAAKASSEANKSDAAASSSLCAESQIREDCGGGTDPASSLATAVADPNTCDPADAGVVHSSAHPSFPGPEGSCFPNSFPLLLTYGERWTLIVTRNTGVFTLCEIRNGEIKAVVKTPSAQMMQDYLNANWPVGTKVQWIVIPPFKPVAPALARNRMPFIPAL